MANATRETFWVLSALALLLAWRWFEPSEASPLWLVGAGVVAVVAWRFRPATWNDGEAGDGYVSLRDAQVPLPSKGAPAADPKRPDAPPLPAAWTTPQPVQRAAAPSRPTRGAERPERTMGTAVFLFWVASPVLGLLVSFLLAIVGFGEAAAAALFAAAAASLIAVGAILNRPNVSGIGRTLLALLYMGTVAFVLFFGGWGAMMVARGGG